MQQPEDVRINRTVYIEGTAEALMETEQAIGCEALFGAIGYLASWGSGPSSRIRAVRLTISPMIGFKGPSMRAAYYNNAAGIGDVVFVLGGVIADGKISFHS